MSNVDVAEIMGHAGPAITEAIYGHVFHSEKADNRFIDVVNTVLPTFLQIDQNESKPGTDEALGSQTGPKAAFRVG